MCSPLEQPSECHLAQLSGWTGYHTGPIDYFEIRVSHKGRVTWYPAGAATIPFRQHTLPLQDAHISFKIILSYTVIRYMGSK